MFTDYYGLSFNPFDKQCIKERDAFRSQDHRQSLELDIPETIQKEDLNALTVREKEILHLVSVSMSNQQIASQLFISEHTVKAHISNILKKLNLSNRTQLAIYEIQSL